MSVTGRTGLDATTVPNVEPTVAAARAKLAFRVRELLADRAWVGPEELAAELQTTTAEVMFAVRELEHAGLVHVVDAPAQQIPADGQA